MYYYKTCIKIPGLCSCFSSRPGRYLLNNILITNILISLIIFELLANFKYKNICIMSKCNLIIIFTHVYKHLKRMHLYTGGNEIVLNKGFSPKKIKTKSFNYSLINFIHLPDFKLKGRSKSFLEVFQSIIINKL